MRFGSVGSIAAPGSIAVFGYRMLPNNCSWLLTSSAVQPASGVGPVIRASGARDCALAPAAESRLRARAPTLAQADRDPPPAGQARRANRREKYCDMTP